MRQRKFIPVLCALLLLSASSNSWAQDIAPAGEGATPGALPETTASYPHEIQLSRPSISPRIAPIIEMEFGFLADSQSRAWSLFGWGSMSVAIGTGLALPWLNGRSPNDETLAAAGAMTATWGLVNAGLAVPWLLNFYAEHRRIQRWTTVRSRDIDRTLREQSERAQRDATVFALMCGLDAAYITAGGFMWGIGDNLAMSNNRMLSGFGMAVVVQGVVGLVIDGWNWIARGNNAGRYSRLIGQSASAGNDAREAMYAVQQ